MALVSGSIPNLIGGVSQQPDPLRLPTQSAVQDNFISSVQDGMIRRPGTEHVARLSTGEWEEGTFIHPIIRGDAERYIAVIRSGAISVYDLNTGLPRTVATPNGLDYLAGADFRAVTVADHTFILNRAITVQMGGLLSPTLPFSVTILVRVNQPFGNYQVVINGSVVVSHTLDEGGASTGTAGIANYLRDTMADNLGSGWTISARGSTIRVSRTDGAVFTCRCDDSAAGDNLQLVGPETQNFSRLPVWTYKDTFTKIVGDGTSAFDDYFVKYDADSLSDGSGVWKETIAQGIPYRINPATMPHILVREADGTFTFKRAVWADRLVGDVDSAPDPSFIGKTISDIFMHASRLGFCSGENVILSRQGHVFDFWPETVTQILDTDRIDVAASHSKVSILRHAVPFNRSVLLFSDHTQFELSGGDLLTPTTAAITVTTEYEGVASAKPAAAGRNVYFAIDRGNFAGLREYSVDQAAEVASAPDVTAHVQRLLPGDVAEIRTATNEDILTVLGNPERTSLYAYRFHFSDRGEKLLSSWFRLCFHDRILSHAFAGSILYLVMQRSGGVFLEKLDISSGAADAGSSILYRLDRRFRRGLLTSPSYLDGWTTFLLPFAIPATDELRVVIGPGDPVLPEGTVILAQRPSDTTLLLQGDRRSSSLIIGRPFTSRCRLSTVYLRQADRSGGSVAITDGRLQLLRMALQFAASGDFRVRVTLPGREPFIYTHTGLDVGDGLMDSPILADGTFRFSVLSQATEAVVEILADGHLPASFLSATWEGRYTTRAKRA